MSSKFFSCIFLSPEHCSAFLISSKLFLTHDSFSAPQKVFTVREKLLRTITVVRRKLLHTASLYTEKPSHIASFYTQKAFTHKKFLHRGFYTQKAFAHSKLVHTASLYTEKPLHTASFYTQKAFTHKKLLRTEALIHSKLLHRGFYTQQAFTHRRRAHELPSIAGCSQLTRKKRNASCPGILPNTSPAFFTTSEVTTLSHGFPKSSPPKVTTSHHFPKPSHFSKSPLP